MKSFVKTYVLPVVGLLLIMGAGSATVNHVLNADPAFLVTCGIAAVVGLIALAYSE